MSAPFARAKAMMAQLASIMLLATHMRGAAMEAIGPYESRGKGKGRTQRSSNTAAQVKRASIKARNVARNKGRA